MPETLASLESLGTPVEVSAIGKELKKLWTADQTRTRATLFNFAVICQGHAMAENTELLSHFVRSHAFHALLIGIEPSTEANDVKAWINAHCYLPKAGAKHVCCEQVSILIRGNVRTLLPNLLFGQLDYDLPLTLWWRADHLGDLDSEIWHWVDRLLFDSRTWPDPRSQFTTLRQALGGTRTILCDLAWTRTLRLRQALAQMFDTPDTVTALQHLNRVAISHAPGARTPAVLLLGWLAAQLGWSAHGARGNHLRFSAGDTDVVCDLTEVAGADVSKVEIASDTMTITASRSNGSDFLQIQFRDSIGRNTTHVMPADCGEITSLLNAELESWGRHRVYLKALTAAEGLL
jgi:glucose-6-phosphate dehydrogenase assembly protein OpcA